MSQVNPTQHEAETFAKYYHSNGGNATNAFKSTFPSSNASSQVASNKGSKLIKTDAVQEILTFLTTQAAEVMDEEYDITLAQQIQLVARTQVKLDKAVQADNLGAAVPLLQSVKTVCELSGFYKEGSGTTIIFQDDFGTPKAATEH